MGNETREDAALNRLVEGYAGIEESRNRGKLGDNVTCLILCVSLGFFEGWKGVGVVVVAIIIGTVANIWEKRRQKRRM